MRLKVRLTTGWKEDATAQDLHDRANIASPSDYVASVARELGAVRELHALDSLVRRRPQGDRAAQRLLAALALIEPHEDIVYCSIDAFAYAWLKGAKNVDLLMLTANGVEFDDLLGRWRAAIRALEAHEWNGEPLADAALRSDHHRLRSILLREAARDERRTLATLLWSGPSTLKDVQEDLSLHYDLGQRVIAPFLDVGIVERRADDRFAIVGSKLPLVLFALRETLGTDPLRLL